MFSPQPVKPASPQQRIFDAVAGEPLPWEDGHRLGEERLTDKQVWRHVVYIGLFERKDVYAALREPFPPTKDESHDERPSGLSAVLGFAVSDKGTLLEDSAVLSACAWATVQALDPGPDSPGWLDGFDDCQAVLAHELERKYLPIVEGKRQPVFLDQDALADCKARAISALEVDGVFPIAGVRVRSERVSLRAADSFEHDFLNSFIADDLAQVARAVGQGDFGPALAAYLRPEEEIDVGGRVDVQAELDAVRRATDPDRVPSGRWPAGPSRPLALGQQLAVDEAVGMRGRDGGQRASRDRQDDDAA